MTQMTHKEAAQWLESQMRIVASGAAVADVSRRVYRGEALTTAVARVRQSMLREALKAWGVWRRCSLSGYPSMDTIGRLRTFGPGVSGIGFCSRPPIMQSAVDEKLGRMDEIVSALKKRDQEKGEIIYAAYVDGQTWEDLEIGKTTWYERLSDAHDAILKIIDKSGKPGY